MPDIQLVLVDPNEAVCEAWSSAFDEFPDVSIVNGRFESVAEFDCLVSAANSFGIMALAYDWYVDPWASIDWRIAQARQAQIGRGGDLMVGTRVTKGAG